MNDILAKRKGFDSRAEYQKYQLKERGFDSRAEYEDHLAQEEGYEDRLERWREYTYDVRGSLPMSENKDCSSYLGIHIAERVLVHVFKNDVERMPPNNPGFDFICAKNKKVDAKSSSLLLGNEWCFHIRHNDIAQQFLLLAFGERPKDDKNLKPMQLWLIPNDVIIRWEEFWNRGSITIKNTPEGL